MSYLFQIIFIQFGDVFFIFAQTCSILDYLLLNLEVTKFILHQSLYKIALAVFVYNKGYADF